MELIARKHIASLHKAGFFSDSKDDSLMLDLSFVDAPKQRNSREEIQKIKEGWTDLAGRREQVQAPA